MIRTAQTDKYLVSQPGAHEVFWTLAPGNISIRWKADPAENRYRGAVEVKRAADLYAQGRTLRQIGAELRLHWSTVSQQRQSAGISIHFGGPPAHPASTQQVLELRDQGLTWNELAKQVDMTVSGAWSRYDGPGRQSPQEGPLAAGSRRRA